MRTHRRPLEIDVSGAHRSGCEVGDRHLSSDRLFDVGDTMIRERIQYEADRRDAHGVQYGLCLVVRHG